MSSPYYHLKVKEVVKETPDAITIWLQQPEGKTISYKPGQFLTFIMEIGGEKVRRAYSLCSSPYTDKDLAVTVKRVVDGKVSNYLFENLKNGQSVEIMEPMGAFTTEFNPKNKRHLILFGGGSGITPLMSLAKSLLKLENDSMISLIYANRNEESIIFKKKFDEMKDEYSSRFNLIHVLEHPPIGWLNPSGILNHDLLRRLLKTIPAFKTENTEYFMCGPQGMMESVSIALQQIGIPEEKVRKESFVSTVINSAIEKSAEELEEEGIVTREVTVIYDKKTYKFTVEPHKTILETALDMDIDLPYSCQSGLCTACRGKAISGKVKLDEEEGLSEAELKQGYVLTCVGHPLTNDVVIEIG